MHNINWKFSITIKGENLEVFDDTYTMISSVIRRKFTRKISLHAARFTSECDLNLVKCQTVGCQMRETWNWIICTT